MFPGGREERDARPIQKPVARGDRPRDQQPQFGARGEPDESSAVGRPRSHLQFGAAARGAERDDPDVRETGKIELFLPAGPLSILLFR